MKIGNLEVYGIIYKITNILNGKVYIGQTIQNEGFNARYKTGGQGIQRVYRLHGSNKKCGRHYNKHLFNSIEKYGFNSFKVDEIFDIAFSKDELDTKEICWISIYKSNNLEYGYNLTEGGDTICDLGKKIICLNTLEVFNSIKEGSDKYNIEKSLRGHLSNPNRHKSAGKHPITDERLIWLYYKDYLNMNKIEVEDYIKICSIRRKCKTYKVINDTNKQKINRKGKQVKCNTTNEVFCSIAEASRKYNISKDRLAEKLKKGTCFHGKNPITKEPLEWQYVI